MNTTVALSDRTISKKGEPLPNGLKPQYPKSDRWEHSLFSSDYQDELFEASNVGDSPLNHARTQSIDAVILKMKLESPQLFRPEALPSVMTAKPENKRK